MTPLAVYLRAAVAYQVDAVELPAGYALKQSILIKPSGGAGNVSIPMIEERFDFNCYGKMFQEAAAVDAALFGALHRAAAGKSVSTNAGTVYLPTAWRVMGPIPMNDPKTGWPMMTSAYMVTMSEWAR